MADTDGVSQATHDAISAAARGLMAANAAQERGDAQTEMDHRVEVAHIQAELNAPEVSFVQEPGD